MPTRAALYREPEPSGPQRYLLWAVGITAFLLALAWASTYSFLLFHGLVEISSAAMGWSIFFLAWNTRRYARNNGYLLFLGSAYFMVGFVALLHTLSYKGMNVFPGHGSDLPTQLWIVARYMEAAAMFFAPMLFDRRVHYWTSLVGWSLVTAVLLLLVFSGAFPVCHVEGVGLTRFKVVSEYVIMAVMALAGAQFLHKLRSRKNRRVIMLLLGSVACTIGSEMSFTFYVGVYDLSNIIGHYFMLGSFWLVYMAIVVEGLSRPLHTLFRDLRESREALRESEELLNEAGAIGRIGGWRVDVETSQVTWSREVYRIHGVDENFAVTMDSALSFYHPEDRPRLEEALERSMEQGEPFDLELRFIPATGGRLWVRSICRATLEQGRPKVLTGVFQDISDQKRAEAMRMDVDRIMRHDLRAPLTAFINFPGIIMEQSGLTDANVRLLGMIEESGRRMLRMLDLSRDLFKMENNEYEPRPVPVDMVSTAREALAEHGGLVRAKHLKTAIHVAGHEAGEGETFLVMGEDLLLSMALSNLVLNAMEAAPDESTVSVSMERGSGLFLVRVHNQGAVPEPVRENFFGKYVTHGKRHGTGLGTYSVQLITRTLGGEVDMETSELEGTTVSLILPAA